MMMMMNFLVVHYPYSSQKMHLIFEYLKRGNKTALTGVSLKYFNSIIHNKPVITVVKNQCHEKFSSLSKSLRNLPDGRNFARPVVPRIPTCAVTGCTLKRIKIPHNVSLNG